ncbi:putative cytochrome P450 3A24 [Apostichopus japonicus]|uniref:Putative cytochrome P450 3A24 n=1 Tax=Stichopus japonicus TaxID=307972 RepID=A0A2G8KRD7_STIJA|nr:putative cytochrome P450 3A24 [Apostichopus japonicus]
MAIWEFFFSPLTLGLGGICFALFLVSDSWKKTYFRRHGIPGPRPLPILGNMLDCSEGMAENLCNMRDEYGKVFGLNFIGSNTLVIGDLDMLQEVFISRFSAFPNHRQLPVKETPMDSAINNLRDSQWKDVRNVLTPAFSGKKMKQMNSIINECCDQLLEHVEEQRLKGTVIQFKSLYGSYSMDVIASTFFGLKVDSQKNPDDPFVKHARKCFETSLFSFRLLAIFLLPFLGPLFDALDIGLFVKEVKVFFHSVIHKMVAARKAGTEKRLDMLQLMVNAHNLDATADKKDDEDEVDKLVDVKLKNETSGKQKRELTTDSITANSMMFFLAGYETTNAAMCFSSYLLATHPDKQETLIEEIDSHCPTPESVQYDVLRKMEYLDCFVRESLRIFPPVAT